MERSNRIREISVQDINPNPNQPRRQFDPAALRALAASLKESGMLQPISVRKVKGAYEIVAGERRFRAAVLAGFQKVPCVLLSVGEEEAAMLALVENVQRAELDCFEEAEAIAHLLKAGGYSRNTLASSLGKAPCTLANKLRLLKLSDNHRDAIREADLTERHARALLAAPEAARSELILAARQGGWSVEELESAIASLQEGSPAFTVVGVEEQLTLDRDSAVPKARRIYLVKDVRIFGNTIRRAVDAMHKAGIDAEFRSANRGNLLEYIIRIPLSAPSEQVG